MKRGNQPKEYFTFKICNAVIQYFLHILLSLSPEYLHTCFQSMTSGWFVCFSIKPLFSSNII